MILRIKHHTHYLYPQPVFIEPQHLYFYPQQRIHYDLLSFDLRVNPSPDGLSRRIDSEGNHYHQCWFNELSDQFRIDVEMKVETKEFNPFDFLVEKSDPNQVLQFYGQQSVKLDQGPKDWISKFGSAEENGVAFLSNVCLDMHDRWEHTMNDSQELHNPNTCFNDSSASCRDLSWMLMCMLRHVKVPVRFVSGYAFNPELEGHELHAWVDAWVNGAGWIGMDPSSGLLATDTYIPLATSYDPVYTLPVQGNFRGGAPSDLKTEVSIQEVD